MIKKLTLTLIVLFMPFWVVLAQNVIAVQGGDGLTSEWPYVTIFNSGGLNPPGNVSGLSTFARSNGSCIRVGGGNPANCTTGTNCALGVAGGEGCSVMHGKTLEFVPFNLSCFQNVVLTAYHRSALGACNGAGYDLDDKIFFEVSLNGGAWTKVDTLVGNNNNTWDFTMSTGGGTNTTPNPFVYAVPAGTTTFAFRMVGIMNRSDEHFYVDDVSLTTTTTGYGTTAGIWTGKQNTNWHNPCNWFSATIPTATTNVSIPDSSINYCEVLAGNIADCNVLDIYDTLKVESASSTINVNAGLNIRATGFLDMSTNPTIGGTINIKGSWRNYRDDTFFDEQGSRVNWTGTSGQTIIVDGGTKEIFSSMQVNKASGRLISNEDIWIDPNNERGNIPVLTLTSGIFDFKTYFKELRIGNFFNGSVVRTGGGVALEDVQNRSKLTRAIDPIQGIYLFPLCNYTTGALTTSQYLPLTISNLSGGLAQVTISTYPTPSTNLPWPVTPVSVANLSSVIGLSPDNRDATADRFWNISSTTPLSGNITFTYNPVELPTLAPYNDPAQLKAQNYDDNVEKWQSYLPGQTAGNYFVTVPSVPIDFTWALSSTPSPLPVELLYFNAIATSKNQVSLNWATATETNSWKFSVERSDGFS
ncbi:MAG: hypothetical protein ACKOKB_06215, partial [Bacteroidota bacterium]